MIAILLIVPLDDFLVQDLETLLHFRNIDIFPPSLLAFP